ncbi:MAG: hypothetical protein GY908_13915 [Flavobacteriales bacterium]|nr:hypothetical protein [Flavobacteriales bacterium]
MNKNILNLISTIVLAFIFSFFMPWWSVMLAAFLAALLFSLKGSPVFFMPFLAIFLFWMGYALLLSSDNDFTLAKKIAVLLPLGGNPYILILVTAIVGGLAAGVSGVFAKQCAELVKKE